MPTDAAPADMPLSGGAAIGATLLGKYQIVRCIAEGGMGIVYEALHLQLQERVAIKILRPDVARSRDGEEFAARFLREARATIKIRSEHVVRVLDVAALDDGSPCIVMEHLDGLDLERRLEQDGALPPREAVDHVLQACEALAEAHVLGIVHRDLKPANLFLVRRPDGTPSIKVLDFGISKLMGNRGVRLTGKHDVMGSPRYMSPEQMRASSALDARSDVWSLGVILYELIAGVPPFDGDAVTEVCASILTDPPSLAFSKLEGTPPGLEDVILRCLEKKPAKRFQDVAELSAALAFFGSPGSQASASSVARVLRKAPMPVLRVGPALAPLAPAPLRDSQRARSRNATTGSVSVPAPNVTLLGATAVRRRRGVAFVAAASVALVLGLVAVTAVERRRAIEAATVPSAGDPIVAPAAASAPVADPSVAAASAEGVVAPEATGQVTVPTVARGAVPVIDAEELPLASPATTPITVADVVHPADPHGATTPRAAPARPRSAAKAPRLSPGPAPKNGDLWEERK